MAAAVAIAMTRRQELAVQTEAGEAIPKESVPEAVKAVVVRDSQRMHSESRPIHCMQAAAQAVQAFLLLDIILLHELAAQAAEARAEATPWAETLRSIPAAVAAAEARTM